MIFMENILETAAQQRLEVTETSKVYLLSIARWTKFLCIISLLGNFFMLLLGIGQLLIGFNSVDSPEFLGFRHFMWSLGLVCIVVGLLMTCPCIRGLKAVHTIKLAVRSDDALAFEKGLKIWRWVCRFTGWFVVVFSIFTILSSAVLVMMVGSQELQLLP